MRRIFLVLVVLLAAPIARAQTPEQLLSGLTGEWEGALGYRDYQSNELFELPVNVSVALAADGRTTIRTARYDEGDAPGVFIVSASAFGQDGRYETAGFRAGRQMTVTRETVALQHFQDAEHWTLIFTERAEDDDRPADIRITFTRDGAETLALKEVDYLEDAAVAWEFRNQTRLRRIE